MLVPTIYSVKLEFRKQVIGVMSLKLKIFEVMER